MSNIVVESKYGKIIASDKDKYVGRALIEYGEFSESEADLFKQIIKKDWVVVDVGANFGVHTLLFSQIAGQVYAFEPQKQVFNALCGTLALNNITNVEPIRAAVGNGCDVKYQDLDMSVENNFGGFSFTTITEGEDLPTFPLNIPCNFLKIDVESMELDVLHGAEDMIRACKPIMYIEADRPDKNEELFAFIRELGYTPFWHSAMFYNPDNFNNNPINHFEGIASINVLCVPNEIKLEGMTEAFAEDWHTLFVSQSY
jgi:FkbM family methyltransferase